MPERDARRVVIVVDEGDREVGVCEKLEAHQSPGVRHRAFSVLLFTEDGRVLLQRRAYLLQCLLYLFVSHLILLSVLAKL